MCVVVGHCDLSRRPPHRCCCCGGLPPFPFFEREREREWAIPSRGRMSTRLPVSTEYSVHKARSREREKGSERGRREIWPGPPDGVIRQVHSPQHSALRNGVAVPLAIERREHVSSPAATVRQLSVLGTHSYVYIQHRAAPFGGQCEVPLQRASEREPAVSGGVPFLGHGGASARPRPAGPAGRQTGRTQLQSEQGVRAGGNTHTPSDGKVHDRAAHSSCCHYTEVACSCRRHGANPVADPHHAAGMHGWLGACPCRRRGEAQGRTPFLYVRRIMCSVCASADVDVDAPAKKLHPQPSTSGCGETHRGPDTDTPPGQITEVPGLLAWPGPGPGLIIAEYYGVRSTDHVVSRQSSLDRPG